MSSGSVVFVNSLRCQSCGLLTSGYLRVQSGGIGTATCPRCGAAITQKIPPGSVHQMPPQDSAGHGHPQVRASPYAWLYMRPKERPGFCLSEVLRIAYSPSKALQRLYLCSDLKHAMILAIVFVVLSNLVGVVVTESMADVLGYSATDALGLAIEGAAGAVVAVLSLLVFGIVASMASREVFGGRGDRGATITLVSYCYPWYALLTMVLLAVFAAGFDGLSLENVNHWNDAEMERAIVFGAALLLVVVVGFVWLLWMVSKAVGVANDMRTFPAALCAVIAVVVSGAVSLAVGLFVRLPIGISF